MEEARDGGIPIFKLGAMGSVNAVSLSRWFSMRWCGLDGDGAHIAKDHKATPTSGEPDSQYQPTIPKFQYNYVMGGRHELRFLDRAEGQPPGSVGGVGVCLSGLGRYQWDDRMLQ